MNLFDVTRGCHNMHPKPRSATQDEMRAYLKWLASERGVFVPHDAEYHPAGIWSRTAGEYVLEMPGYGQKQVATCEVLDDAGNVVRTMALPQDKRGGIPATAKQVQEWTGLKPVKASKAKRVTPTVDVAPAPRPVEQRESATPTADAPEAVEAPQRAPESEAVKGSLTTAPVDMGDVNPAHIGHPEALETPDFSGELLDVMARLDALERAVATLSAETGPSVEQARPKRTAAHERAIRRAWAERAARRAAQADAAEWEALQHRTWEQAMGHKMARRRAVMNARRIIAKWRAQSRDWSMTAAAYQGYLWRDMDKRRAGAQRARRMVAEARGRADLDRRALAATNAELAKIKRDLADPSQPERASDIARLVTERDQARTALAAVTARADRQQAALDQMAGQFEAMVSRVTRAEAAMRKAGLIAA